MAVPPEGPDTQSQPLTFPPTHFAKLAPADFLHASISSPDAVRPNGRALTQIRSPSINSGSLTNANGSAVVRLGATSVVCGVRAELLPVSHIHGGLPLDLEAWQTQGARPREESGVATIRSDADVIADLRLLVPNLELSTGCNPSHLPGNAPSAEAQGLTQRIVSLLRTTDLVDLESLLAWHTNILNADTAITAQPHDPDDMEHEEESLQTHGREIKAIWTLYIDILYISLDGAAFDTAWLAILAALRDTLLPKAIWDEDREILVCSPARSDATPLTLRDLPVPLTASLFSHFEKSSQNPYLLFDADDFEESACQGQICVVIVRKIDRKTKSGSTKTEISRIEAHGRGVSLGAISKLIEAAEIRWKKWQVALSWKI